MKKDEQAKRIAYPSRQNTRLSPAVYGIAVKSKPVTESWRFNTLAGSANLNLRDETDTTYESPAGISSKRKVPSRPVNAVFVTPVTNDWIRTVTPLIPRPSDDNILPETETPAAVNGVHCGNLTEANLIIEVEVEVVAIYICVYQKVQSSIGSMFNEL